MKTVKWNTAYVQTYLIYCRARNPNPKEFDKA